MFLDSYAIIAQQDGDGGDSLHREGMYAFGKWLRHDQNAGIYWIEDLPTRREPATIMSRFEVRPGIYVRHPDPSRWYSNPDTTSRDQVVPVIAYCGAYQDYARLWRLFKATAGRAFFAQNTLRIGDGEVERKVPDTMIAFIGLFIRAGGWYTAPLYPLLFLTDAIDLVGTVFNTIPLHWDESRFQLRWAESRDVDDNNTIIAHLVAARFKPTPLSWLNRMLYAYTRQRNYGNSVLGEENAVMGALAWYHRLDAGGNPELAELYRPLIEEYFSPRENVRHVMYEMARFYDRFSGTVLTSSLN